MNTQRRFRLGLRVRVRVRGPVRAGLPVAVCLAGLAGLAGLPPPARAALWTLDRSVETRLQADDNPDLSPRPGAAAHSVSLSGLLATSLQTPTRSTRLDADATAWWTGQGSAQNRVDARLGLNHTWRLETAEWRWGGQAQQETTFSDRVSLLAPTTAPTTGAPTGPGAAGADLGLGRGQRRSIGLNTGYSHAFNDVLTAQLQAQTSRTQYGRALPGAVDFRNVDASAALSWRSTERNTWNAQLGQSHFATQPQASSTSRSSTFTLGATHALSETSSASISLGAYRSVSASSQNISVCPLPGDFCQLGLVAPVLVQLRGTRRDSGLQYSAAYSAQWLETTRLRLQADRQQAPSGSGVVLRSDRLLTTLEHSFSERAGLDASYLFARSAYTGLAGSPRPQLQVLQAALARRLGEGLSLRAGLQWTHSGEATLQLNARSHQVYVTLRLDGRRLDATR